MIRLISCSSMFAREALEYHGHFPLFFHHVQCTIPSPLPPNQVLNYVQQQPRGIPFKITKTQRLKQFVGLCEWRSVTRLDPRPSPSPFGIVASDARGFGPFTNPFTLCIARIYHAPSRGETKV